MLGDNKNTLHWKDPLVGSKNLREAILNYFVSQHSVRLAFFTSTLNNS